jgi:hypothetical protein
MKKQGPSNVASQAALEHAGVPNAVVSMPVNQTGIAFHDFTPWTQW